MRTFIQNENLKRFRHLLEGETDPERRAKLERLIEEEEGRDLSRPSGQTAEGGKSKS